MKNNVHNYLPVALHYTSLHSLHVMNTQVHISMHYNKLNMMPLHNTHYLFT